MLIKYSGKYVKIYFNMKITYSSAVMFHLSSFLIFLSKNYMEPHKMILVGLTAECRHNE